MGASGTPCALNVREMLLAVAAHAHVCVWQWTARPWAGTVGLHRVVWSVRGSLRGCGLLPYTRGTRGCRGAGGPRVMAWTAVSGVMHALVCATVIGRAHARMCISLMLCSTLHGCVLLAGEAARGSPEGLVMV